MTLFGEQTSNELLGGYLKLRSRLRSLLCRSCTKDTRLSVFLRVSSAKFEQTATKLRRKSEGKLRANG